MAATFFAEKKPTTTSPSPDNLPFHLESPGYLGRGPHFTFAIASLHTLSVSRPEAKSYSHTILKISQLHARLICEQNDRDRKPLYRPNSSSQRCEPHARQERHCVRDFRDRPGRTQGIPPATHDHWSPFSNPQSGIRNRANFHKTKDRDCF